jgi:hypothetical protein
VVMEFENTEAQAVAVEKELRPRTLSPVEEEATSRVLTLALLRRHLLSRPLLSRP